MVENEASYLVKTMPDLTGAAFKDIEQHYLSEGKEPLRIRRAEGRSELTKKLRTDPADLSRREEINIPLTEEEYAKLRPLAVRGLEKRRHLVPLADGLVAEVDVFKGPLEGFVKAEVEFPDEAARASFRPPEWFGRDVSQEAWASNSWLAGKTYADVERQMK